MKRSEKDIRLANFIIDSIAIIIIVLAITFITYYISPDILEPNSPSFDILFLVIYFGYYLLFEVLTNRTLGKMITKTIVVTRKGDKPKLTNLIGRNVARLVPFDALTFLLGSVGLHDLLSGTTVTKRIPVSPNSEDTILKTQ